MQKETGFLFRLPVSFLFFLMQKQNRNFKLYIAVSKRYNMMYVCDLIVEDAVLSQEITGFYLDSGG